MKDCHSILNTWKNYFSHLLMYMVQTEMHIPQALVPESSFVQDEIVLKVGYV